MTASLNPYISQFSEAFDAEKSSQYRMAIQCALGGLSFALLDTKTQNLVGLEFYQSELLTDSNDLFRTLERALESKGLNNKAFQSVTCLIDNRFCTLVPETLFNEADQSKYLDFGFQLPESYTIASESLASVECRIVFAFPKALQDKMLSKWKDAGMAAADPDAAGGTGIRHAVGTDPGHFQGKVGNERNAVYPDDELCGDIPGQLFPGHLGSQRLLLPGQAEIRETAADLQ